VGVSGEFEAELRYICDLFGEGWTPHQVLLSFADLERAGLGRRGGSFAEIILLILANYLWEDIKRLLTVEDIEEALPQIDLPEKKRKMLEKALRVWRYGK